MTCPNCDLSYKGHFGHSTIHDCLRAMAVKLKKLTPPRMEQKCGQIRATAIVGRVLPVAVRSRITEIIQQVADHYRLEPFEIRRHTNAARFVQPRQVAMFVLHQQNLSTTVIGRLLGGFHHTTVLHGIEAVEQRREYDAALDEFLRSFPPPEYMAKTEPKPKRRPGQVCRFERVEAKSA